VDHRDRHHRVQVDHVVLTGHAHDVLPVLEDPTDDERKILRRFSYQRARLVEEVNDTMKGVEVSPDGRLAYVAEMEGYLSVFDLATSQQLSALEVDGSFAALDLAPDGSWAVITSPILVNIIDVTNPKQTKWHPPEPAPIILLMKEQQAKQQAAKG